MMPCHNAPAYPINLAGSYTADPVPDQDGAAEPDGAKEDLVINQVGVTDPTYDDKSLPALCPDEA